ncbi:MAG: exodeoxyribonuclease VII large subunit [Erysipelotrichaceae bacterium]|jgi:exodeoxyribonuclease VII large subunit|nr:exodeoxyribonuclease VII large subunit [Erysipelotrichaceae bacterium]
MSRRAIGVSALVHYLKETMEGNPILHGILVEGEISNLRIPYSGHWYFSLKDERAGISCVMFASSNRRTAFVPKNGDKVIICGDVSVYEAGGTMQIIVQTMQPSGIGDLFMQLEALKKKLSAEGLFQEDHKKKIPPYPMRIALITGNQTAGREDVLITLKRRWPIAEIAEYPCPVQGKGAAGEICKALMKADKGQYDVILLVRGGGSLEDLWCFNDEQLAHAIYNAGTPLITGIGHETDFTIADYAADVRANTPTGAAETAVPDQNEVLAQLQQWQIRMYKAVQNRIDQDHARVRHLKESSVFLRPERIYSEQSNLLNYLEERLMRFTDVPKDERHELNELIHSFYAALETKKQALKKQLDQDHTQMILAINHKLAADHEQLKLQKHVLDQSIKLDTEAARSRLGMQIKLLDAYSPLKAMERGYSIVSKNNRAVSSIQDVAEQDTILIQMKDGSLHAAVISKEKKHDESKTDL